MESKEEKDPVSEVTPEATSPVVAPEPTPAPVEVAAPVAPAPAAAPAIVASENFMVTYFKTLKTLFTEPKSFFDNPPATFVKSLIFPGISLAIMAILSIIVNIVSALTVKSTILGYLGKSTTTINGDFFAGLFQNLGLSLLYVAIFMAAIAGIFMIVALIGKKTVAFKDIFSMTSIFSLNFLAIAVSMFIGLFAGWVSNVDFTSIINLINNVIVSLVFVYAGILIIQGINDVTGFNIFKSTAIYLSLIHI